jgi:hypothetical protein
VQKVSLASKTLQTKTIRARQSAQRRIAAVGAPTWAARPKGQNPMAQRVYLVDFKAIFEQFLSGF